MKRIVPFLATSLLAAGTAAAAAIGTLAYLDEANGFRSFHFGTPLDSFVGLSQVETDDPRKICFVRAGEDLRVGDARLVAIRYCFTDRRLSAVELEAAGERNAEALHDFLRATYGAGVPEDAPGGSQRYFWPGRAVRAFFSDPASGVAAEARVWSIAMESGNPPAWGHDAYPRSRNYGLHDDHDPRPPVARGRTSFALNVPQHANPGLLVQISVRYRNLAPPGRVRIDLPRGLRVEQTVPEASVGRGGVIVWENLADITGSAKIKARVHPEAPIGAALLIRADLEDRAGKLWEKRDTIVVH